jgi:hypothetical protein
MAAGDALGKVRQPKRRAFLAALARTCNICRAAKAAGIDRDNHYLWMREPDYAAAFRVAWERGVDFLEAEAAERATVGVREPVFAGGKRTVDFAVDEDGHMIFEKDPAGNFVFDSNGKKKPIAVPAFIWRKSDTLLMFLLNGARPTVYRNRASIEHTGKDGEPLVAIQAIQAAMEAGAKAARAKEDPDEQPVTE